MVNVRMRGSNLLIKKGHPAIFIAIQRGEQDRVEGEGRPEMYPISSILSFFSNQVK